MNNFGKSLYSDLRERHLLPVIAVLLVALVAIPFLWGGGDEAAPSSSTPALAAAEPTFETDPVVLASEPELRSFQKRLKEFQTRNPFNQYLPKSFGKDTAESAEDAVATDTGATGTVDEVTSVDTGDTGLPPVPTDDTPVEPLPEDPGVDDDGTGGDTDGGGDDDGGNSVYTARVDVRMGPIGDLKVYRDVKNLEFLPDRQTPVVEYLQSDLALESSVFIVSGFVLETEGDGKCAPNPSNCQFLQLPVGGSQTFQYNDGKRYRMTLLDIVLHEEDLGRADGEDPAGREPDFSTDVPAAMSDPG